LEFDDFSYEFKIVTTLFLLALFAGIMQSGNPAEWATSVLDQIIKLAEQFGADNPINLFSFILVNNLIAVFSVIIGGIIFGISPISSSIVNGYIIGIVAGGMIASDQGLELLAGILPHGIMELPALGLALALGLSLGREFYAGIKNFFLLKSNKKTGWYIKFRLAFAPLEIRTIASLKFAWNIIVPLIVVSAIIEAVLTPELISLVSKIV